MQKSSNGSWIIELNGICYREMYRLGELLMELGEHGNIGGTVFDLDSLEAGFDANEGDVFLYDREGNTSWEEE